MIRRGMVRPILFVKIGLGGLVFAARWGENGATEEAPGESPSEEPLLEEPGDFLKRHLEYELSGQFGRSWDDLHPAHQEVVTRERYEQCRAELFERSPAPTELVAFDVLEVADEAIAVAGLSEHKQSSAAVTAHIAIGVNGNSRSNIDTLHALRVDGRWAWVFSPGAYRAYAAAGSRPTAPPS